MRLPAPRAALPCAQLYPAASGDHQAAGVPARDQVHCGRRTGLKTPPLHPASKQLLTPFLRTSRSRFDPSLAIASAQTQVESGRIRLGQEAG